MRRSVVAITAVALLMLAPTAAGAATSGAVTSGDKADPAERVNRVGYAIHQVFDHYLIRPAAMAFKAVTPKFLRHGLENVLTNLSEPVVAGNDLLQGRVSKAGAATLRFMTNTTVGVGGVFDVANGAGLPHHDNGFALTLARAGVKPGPYLFIPLVGPTTVRDAIGNGIDGLTNPFHWLAQSRSETLVISQTVVAGLDERVNADADLTALMSEATDPYATLRSVYLQNQQSKIDDSAAAAVPALPDFDDDNVTPPAPSSPPPTPTS